MKKLLFSLALVAILFLSAAGQKPVQIEWYGHACFRLTMPDDYKIVLDPFAEESFEYTLPQATECVLCTHDHFDHNNWQAFNAAFNAMASGKTTEFKVFTEGTEYTKNSPFTLNNGQITVYTVPSFHDDQGGKLRGMNGIICIETQELRFVHLGDLGNKLSRKQLNAIGAVDILFVSAGGKYTIEPETAYEVCCQIQPKIVFPMHYQTDRLDPEFRLANIGAFTKLFDETLMIDDYRVEISASDLPPKMELWILEYHP